MRKFSQEEWYFDGFTWCGTTDNGERYYPISYDDNGTAYGMTPDISRCLNFGTINRVKEQLKAELRYNPFFPFRYKKIELVRIKEYPTFYFDYKTIARKLKIKIDHRWHDEELVPHLMKYGFEPISTNPKIIEVSRDNGELYQEVVESLNKDQSKVSVMEIKNSCFNFPTYLLNSVKDMMLLAETVSGAERIAWMYDEEINGFSTIYDEIYFPCFAVINGTESTVYSVDDVKELYDNAKSMLDIVCKRK